MEMRKFALMTLRDLGVGKKSIDEMVQTESTILCQELEEMCKNGSAIVPNFRLQSQRMAANILHHIIFGFR